MPQVLLIWYKIRSNRLTNLQTLVFLFSPFAVYFNGSRVSLIYEMSYIMN